MADKKDEKQPIDGRRQFLAETVRAAGVLVVGGALGTLVARAEPARSTLWQIDPSKCTQCGKCATECVLKPSAVKMVRAFPICGYCDLCFGFFQESQVNGQNEGAENQRCPVQAITRQLVEKDYYQYTVDENKCIGCGKCAEGCNMYGNGAMYLQVRHHLCVNCNQCSIAAACPSLAFERVPANRPYNIRMKGPRG